jgi:hypothetical protein
VKLDGRSAMLLISTSTIRSSKDQASLSHDGSPMHKEYIKMKTYCIFINIDFAGMSSRA